jgi:hypothetical protein
VRKATRQRMGIFISSVGRVCYRCLFIARASDLCKGGD